jgi:hypothetical protein
MWIILIILAACAPIAPSQPKALVPLSEIVSGGPPKDGIPSIDNPKFVSAEQATFLSDNTLGMYVDVNGDKRFYPTNILAWHEIVNDVVGGKPLAITFCPLCGSALVFERTISGEIFEFGTSGMLYQSNLVMYDRQTDSLWSQILGKAIVGQLVGTELTLYPADTLLFSTIKTIPDVKILSTDTGYVRDYQHNPYYDYEKSDEIIFPVNNKDARLPAKTHVWTISVDGVMKSYVIDKLIEEKHVQDSVNGHQLDISIDEKQAITVLDKTTGKNIIGFRALWFSVVAHNPEIKLWQGSKQKV